MAISRIKVWIAGEVLTASDLNTEFNNIINNIGSIVVGTMTDGTPTSPGLQFFFDADTGIYRAGTNMIGFAAGGVTAFTASTYASAVNFPVLVPSQTATGVVYTASGSDTNVAVLLRGKGTGYVQASSFVFENFAATQSPTITGRTYWQSTEGALHISAGTVMARVPALTGVQAGDLIAAANPTGVSGATVYARVQRPPAELCRLVYETSTKLNLASGYIPLKVGGVWVRRDVHTAVELLSPTVASNTLYYIYAYDNAGVTTLEASTTAHVAATQHGVRVKSGDETRTLVGIAFAETVGAFLVSTATQFVHTWFNRPTRRCHAKFSTNRTSIAGSYTEVDAEIQNRFVCWNDEIFTIGIMASVNNAANQAVSTAVGIDGSAEVGTGLHSSAAASITVGCGGTFSKGNLSEGTHYATIMGQTSAGSTGTWLSDGSTGRYTSLSTTIS